jgi:hypothetical protein
MSPQDGIKIRDWVKAELVECDPEKVEEVKDKAKEKLNQQKPDDIDSASERPPTDEPK